MLIKLDRMQLSLQTRQLLLLVIMTLFEVRHPLLGLADLVLLLVQKVIQLLAELRLGQKAVLAVTIGPTSHGPTGVDHLTIQGYHPQLVPASPGNHGSVVQAIGHNRAAQEVVGYQLKLGIKIDQINGPADDPRHAGNLIPGAGGPPVDQGIQWQDSYPAAPVLYQVADDLLTGRLPVNHQLLKLAAEDGFNSGRQFSWHIEEFTDGTRQSGKGLPVL